MARIIIEQTTGLTTQAAVLTMIENLRKFAKANPSLIGTLVATKTAVSTVQADGATSAATELTSALSDFVTDAVAVGDYVTILKSDEEANIGTWRVTSITDLNTLVLDSDLTTDTGMSFTVDRGKHVRHDADDINLFMID